MCVEERVCALFNAPSVAISAGWLVCVFISALKELTRLVNAMLAHHVASDILSPYIATLVCDLSLYECSVVRGVYVCIVCTFVRVYVCACVRMYVCARVYVMSTCMYVCARVYVYIACMCARMCMCTLHVCVRTCVRVHCMHVCSHVYVLHRMHVFCTCMSVGYTYVLHTCLCFLAANAWLISAPFSCSVVVWDAFRHWRCRAASPTPLRQSLPPLGASLFLLF